MKTYAKLISFALVLLLTLSTVLVGCAPKDDDTANTTTTGNGDTVATPDKTLKVNVTVLSGTTGMGMAQLMSESKAGNSALTYNFNVISDATQIAAGIVGGSVDIAAAPTNLASTLYKKTEGGVYVLALSALGVLYVVENGTAINSAADLRGKTVYVPGQGTNPEYILQYILEENGLTVGTDVFFDYTYNTPDTLTAAVSSGLADIALLPEPKVTVAKSSNTSLRTALDLTAEWDKVAEDGSLVQSCVIVRKAFADAHPVEIKAFLEEYKESVEFVNSDVDAASQLIQDAGIIPKAALAKKAIPGCNIKYIDGAEMKTALTTFYGILFKLAPASIGGALPDDGLYYTVG